MSPRNAVAVALLNDPNECVVVDLDALPTDVEDVASVLQAELAPLEAWIEVTEAYLRRGDARGFETLMEMVCAPGAWTRAATDGTRRARERTNERTKARERLRDRAMMDRRAQWPRPNAVTDETARADDDRDRGGV
jgi:hypothetical protein